MEEEKRKVEFQDEVVRFRIFFSVKESFSSSLSAITSRGWEDEDGKRAKERTRMVS